MAGGRVFRDAARVGIGDVAPDGRSRLDAIARWLQDAAFADVLDAGLAEEGAWVVRRCRIEVQRFACLHEALSVDTFCTGTGRMWAQRTSTIEGDRGARIEAVALWVHLEADSARPRKLGDGFMRTYGESAGGREVKARLRHPPPPAAADSAPWTFRAADLDLAGHVNNAVYWAVLEEELAGRPVESFAGEVEHRTPAGAGPAEVVSAAEIRWVCGGGEVHASFVLDRSP